LIKSAMLAGAIRLRQDGFNLIRSEECVSFGQSVVSEDWEMQL
jgi:hypothetical protein